MLIQSETSDWDVNETMHLTQILFCTSADWEITGYISDLQKKKDLVDHKINMSQHFHGFAKETKSYYGKLSLWLSTKEMYFAFS